ncbi:hypothetical protein GOODEAATRI_008308 [Goodea atripinnis]|uniref:protein-tyrosine-phosphatase n=1 Tax=Goodea atripinnis TaxID=208336 RepID=A0ABV0NSR6_9TELE
MFNWMMCFRVNSGFEEQLHLYEAMHWEVDTSSPSYKQYRLQKITEKYPELQQGAPELPREIFACDPAHSSPSEMSYRCRKCRRTLFRGSSILSHAVGDGASAFSHKKPSNLTGRSTTSLSVLALRYTEHIFATNLYLFLAKVRLCICCDT